MSSFSPVDAHVSALLIEGHAYVATKKDLQAVEKNISVSRRLAYKLSDHVLAVPLLFLKEEAATDVAWHAIAINVCQGGLAEAFEYALIRTSVNLLSSIVDQRPVTELDSVTQATVASVRDRFAAVFYKSSLFPGEGEQQQLVISSASWWTSSVVFPSATVPPGPRPTTNPDQRPTNPNPIPHPAVPQRGTTPDQRPTNPIPHPNLDAPRTQNNNPARQLGQYAGDMAALLRRAIDSGDTGEVQRRLDEFKTLLATPGYNPVFRTRRKYTALLRMAQDSLNGPSAAAAPAPTFDPGALLQQMNSSRPRLQRTLQPPPFPSPISQPQLPQTSTTCVVDGVTYVLTCVHGKIVWVPLQQPVLTKDDPAARLALLYAERRADQAEQERRNLARDNEIAALEAMCVPATE